MPKLWAAAAVGLLSLHACRSGDARIEQESAAFRQLLPSIARRYEQWTAAGQADSIANLFDSVGRELPPNEPAVVGTAAIQARHARLATWGRWQIQLTQRSGMAYGRNAAEDGGYIVTFTPGPNAPAGMIAMTDTGKYLAHWLREADGQWRILQLAWTSDIPLQRATPPANNR